MSFDGKRFHLAFGEIFFRRACGDMVGDDLDHVHIGNELVEQAFQSDQRTPDRGDGTRHFNAVALRHLRQCGEHGGDVEFGKVDGAEFLNDHIQVGQQGRVVFGIGFGSGKPQQSVGERGRILFGDRENHVFQHGTGFRIEPTRHA